VVDRIEHRDEVFCHIIIPKPDHAVAVCRQFRRALLVGGKFIGVLTAVEFDDELLLGTRKVSTRFPIGCWRRNLQSGKRSRKARQRILSASVESARSLRAMMLWRRS